jgi:hypothetical protein
VRAEGGLASAQDPDALGVQAEHLQDARQAALDEETRKTGAFTVIPSRLQEGTLRGLLGTGGFTVIPSRLQEGSLRGLLG